MSAPLRVDLHLTGDQVSLDDMIRFGVLAERSGLGGVWAAEVWRDSLVSVGAIAAATSTIRVGTSVAQWTRPAPTLATAAGDLAELSNSRFTLGLGAAPRHWNEAWHGISYDRPLRRMREYVEAMRVLWQAGPVDPVSYAGELVSIDNYVRLRGPLGEPPPIHLGVTLPGMAALGGEIADGINFNVTLTSPYIRDALLPAVEIGAARAGRSLDDVELGVVVSAAVSDNRAQAVRWGKHQLAFNIGAAPYFDPVMRAHGFAEEYARVHEAFVAGDVASAIDRVTDRMVDELVMAGRPDEVRQKLERFEGVVDFVALYAPTFTLEPDSVLEAHEAMIAAFNVA